MCFVLNEYSDDPDTSAYMVGQKVPLPTEATEQIPLTPTFSAAVDIKNTATFNDRAMNEAIRKFKSGTYRGMLYGIVLRVDAKSFLAIRTRIPSSFRARCVVPFERKNVIRSGPSFMFSSTHGPQGEQRTHAKDVSCRLWNSH